MNDNIDRETLKSRMYRYMSQELVEELLKDDAKLEGDRKEISVLFSDIRSFSSLTERLEAEEVVTLLNNYFELMVGAIFKYQGTLDKYIGAALMAVFGSPAPLENHAWCAVQTAVEMRHRLAEFNAHRAAINKEPLRIGIGINSDTVFTGNVGSSKCMEFTGIGNGVNLASRLEGVSKQYGCDIVISDTTYRPCADRIWARELDRIRCKGTSSPVTIYEVVGLRSEPISAEKQEAIKHYHQGREYYLQRKFTRAMGEFGIVLEDIDKNDKAAALYLKRCQHYLREPPPRDWEGIWLDTYGRIS